MATFNPAGGGGVPVTANIPGVTTPSISNTTLATANTEYSISVPVGTTQFLLKSRTPNAILKLAYSMGESGTTYLTLIPGTVYEVRAIDGSASITIYIQSNKASTVVELVSWQ